jgi:hypothetical protein
MPKAILLTPYSVHPYENKDKINKTKGNNTRAVRRVAVR